MLRRIFQLALILTLFVVLLRSSTRVKERVVFSQPPVATMSWEITGQNYHLGEVIEATLRISLQSGASLNLDGLPDVGENLRLPPKQDPNQLPAAPRSQYGSAGYEMLPMLIPEGELEIVSRTIKVFRENGQVIIQVKYGLIYLQPLDLTQASDDKLLPALVLAQAYWLRTNDGRVISRTSTILPSPVPFYIVPRLDETSAPLFARFNLALPVNYWPAVRIGGLGLIGLAVGLVLWPVVRFVVNRRHRGQMFVEVPPEAEELYSLWIERQDDKIFKDALILYGRGVWGHPQAMTWLETMRILYSGRTLSLDQMKTVFAKIVREVHHDHSL